MPDIYRYTDYRAYLSDWFEENKKLHAYMSYRYLGGKIPTDPGNLVRILSGRRHISDAMLPGLIKALRLMDREAEYFQAMVPFSKARGERSVREALQKLLALREFRVKTLESEQYKFYLSWRHTVVRLMVALGKFDGDYAALARLIRPEITAEEAEDSIALLLELGMVRRDDDGTWSLTESFISTGDVWKDAAVKEFQRQTLRLAQESLERHPREDRSISTVSLTIPRAELPFLKEMTKQFRSQVMRWAGAQDKPDTVYQLNMQIFPLSRPFGSEDPVEQP